MSTKILIEGTTDAAWWRLTVTRDGAQTQETCHDFAHAHRLAAEIMGIAEPASRATDDTVNSLMTGGATPAQVIDALADQKAQMLKKIIELELIAPKRISHGGKAFIWHCPDELVPEQGAQLLETGVAR